MSKYNSAHGKSASAPLAEKQKRVAKYGNKRSKEVYSSYDEKSAVCGNLRDDIELIENIIKNNARTVAAEKGKPARKVKLSSVQKTALRRELAEKKLELKQEEQKLKTISGTYLTVNVTNKTAAKHKSKKLNQQIRWASSAKKQKDELSSTVTKLVQSLESRKDPRITMLRETAIVNGLKFYNIVFQIVRSELKGKEALDLLKASSSVRGGIFKEVRQRYGYLPKR